MGAPNAMTIFEFFEQTLLLLRYNNKLNTRSVQSSKELVLIGGG